MNEKKIYTLRCPSCKTKNRIPEDKAGKSAKCGKCGSPISTFDIFNGKAINVNDNNFSDKVLDSPLPVLLDCWAPWCGPCKMIGPIIEELAKEWQGKIRVCKLNVDDNPNTAAKFNIRSIPTLLIFENSKLKNSLVGAQPKQQIIRAMYEFL
jgi:thioredoxin 2